MAQEEQPPTTSYIVDPESAAEIARRINLQRIMTQGMGGLFPEQPDVSMIHEILDIACGPGSWVLDVAFEYPEMDVTGVDSSPAMIRYARAQGVAQRLPNARFKVMDLSMPLGFADETFDLINARFLSTAILSSYWPTIISECVRLLRPGGILRLTEAEPGITTSPAWEHMMSCYMQALHAAGYSFSPNGSHVGVTPMLRKYLRDTGFKGIQEQAYALNFSAGTEFYEGYYQNHTVLFQLLKPFLLRMGVMTEDEFERLYLDMNLSMLLEDFCGIWFCLTAWGFKPEQGGQEDGV